MVRNSNGSIAGWVKWVMGIILMFAFSISGYAFSVMNAKVDKELFNQTQTQCDLKFAKIDKAFEIEKDEANKKIERLERKIDFVQKDITQILIQLGKIEERQSYGKND